MRTRRIRLLLAYYGLLMVWLGTTAMHIPDGYLSPVTSLVMFLLTVPFWAIGVRKLRETMNARSVPLVALTAAFSFVIMMFNIPLPGGTTGHAVGATLAAIVLGPEVATISVSIALIIQAFFFGDGGILAIGANCFNMAVVVPYLGAAIYRFAAGGKQSSSRRRFAAAVFAGWFGLTISALFAGVEFGIQPLLFRAADGSPLYAPYPLSIAIPAMVIPHALIASVVEGLLTALVLAYLQHSGMLQPGASGYASAPMSADIVSRLRWLWLALIVLAVMSPVGLLAPGTAWGEWNTAQLTERGLGFVPAGLRTLSELWGAPLAGYDLPALGNTNLGYVLSAAIGIVLVVLLVWLFLSLLTGRMPAGPSTGVVERDASEPLDFSAARTRSSVDRPAGSRSQIRIIEGTLSGITAALERGLFAEEISQRAGLFQKLDPRVKTVGTLALLISVSLARNLAVIIGIYVVVLILAWQSKIAPAFLLKRVWLALPLFTGLIAIPALFLTPGQTLWSLPGGLSITSGGVMTVLFLLLRVSTSLSLALLLILTTPWNSVLAALGMLRVPAVFTLMLGMTHRYIHLLLRLANDMFLSRRGRVVGPLSTAESQRLVGAAAGSLLARSLSMSSEVYLAMQSRGFRGRVVALRPFKMHSRDWVWLVLLSTLSAACIALGQIN